MKTPNPRGMVRDTTWEKLQLAKRIALAHWSYDENLAKELRKSKRERLLAGI